MTTRTTTKKKQKLIGVLDYLVDKLPKSDLLLLYQDATRGKYVCRAVLQQTSSLAQQVVLRLCCCGGSFPTKGVLIWTKSKGEFLAIVKELQKWSILDSSNKDLLTLTPQYQKGLQASLEQLDSSPWTPLSESELQKAATAAATSNNETNVAIKKRKLTLPTLNDLDQYTQHQWNVVLHFLVGTPSQQEEPPPAVIHFLLQTGLMQTDPDHVGASDTAPLVISQKGYDFMLQEHSQQVWHFVLQYLKSLESHKKGKELSREALLFLICLSFGRVGDAYNASVLTKNARTLMKDLSLFGLLYLCKLDKNHVFFYPTRVAMQLLSSDNGNVDSKHHLAFATSNRRTNKAMETTLSSPIPDDNHLAIIVQTNFQVCAYTSSELHVSMLGLFCDVSTIRRLPNMVFLSMTRDSIKSAFGLGIQASQILRFLEKHAHYKLNNSSLPQNVVDQVWLWDRERHRCTWTQVHVHTCLLPGELEAVVQHSKKIGAHGWSSSSKNEVLIKFDRVDKVLGFVRKWRANMTQRGDA